jgi:hypothetical protein
MARHRREEQATGDEEAAEQQDSHHRNLDCPSLPHFVSFAEALEHIIYSSIISVISKPCKAMPVSHLRQDADLWQ